MERDDLIGKEIGNYRITEEINSGAYGRVYRAEHINIKGRIVAIKLLHAYLGSAKEREQFEQEAQILALLEHPHILSLLDFGFSERRPYLIARYAAGGSLRAMLKRQAPLPIEKAITILIQVGQALHYAHQQQIIHRDLKPENILFNAQGEVLLADFGIATMLSTASVKHLTTIGGTPSYMAPEQFQGIISREGDQYALGCIAYELVTAHQPFMAPDFLSMGWKHMTEQPIPPTRYNPLLPPAIEAAILKAMTKQRAERHADILVFLAALREPFSQTTVLNKTPAIHLIQPPVLAPASSIPSISSTMSPSSSLAVQEFSHKEQLYLDWIHSHPHGYVINTGRSKNPSYMVLHRAWCKTMNHYSKNAAPGGFTERDYIKVCASDLSSLRDWVRQHGRSDGTFSAEHQCYK